MYTQGGNLIFITRGISRGVTRAPSSQIGSHACRLDSSTYFTSSLTLSWCQARCSHTGKIWLAHETTQCIQWQTTGCVINVRAHNKTTVHTTVSRSSFCAMKLLRSSLGTKHSDIHVCTVTEFMNKTAHTYSRYGQANAYYMHTMYIPIVCTEVRDHVGSTVKSMHCYLCTCTCIHLCLCMYIRIIMYVYT